MLRSNNVLDGALPFHLKVEKGEDGNFTASVPSQPEIPVGVGHSHQVAVNKLKVEIQKAVATGKTKSFA